MKRLGLVVIIGLISLPAYGLFFDTPDLGGDTSAISTGDTFNLELPDYDTPLFETATDPVQVFEESLRKFSEKLAEDAISKEDIWSSAGVAAPTINELTERFYNFLKDKGITDFSIFYRYTTTEIESLAEYVKNVIVKYINDQGKAPDEAKIDTFVEQVKTSITTYRVTSLETKPVTELIIGVVNTTLSEYFIKCAEEGIPTYTEEEWDETLGNLVENIRNQVLGGAEWDEREILAKVISIQTGLSTEEILADPYAPQIQTAINSLKEEWQQVLNNAL